MILECDLIIGLAHVIEHKDFQIRKDAVWLSSNLLAGPPENIDRCIDAGLVSWLLEILLDNSTGIKDNDISLQQHIELQNESIHALANSTLRATDEQLIFLINNEMMRALFVAFTDTENY